MCIDNALSIKFETSKPVIGEIFLLQSPQCRIEVNNYSTFYFEIPLNNSSCKIFVSDVGFYNVDLKFQNHQSRIIDSDLVLNAMFDCGPASASTTTDVPSTIAPPLVCPETTTVQPVTQQHSCPVQECQQCKIEPPQLGITVLHRNGSQLTHDPQIGDPVVLAFYLSQIDGSFAPRIYDVAAVNVNDNSFFQMLDKRGCPVKPYIAGSIYKFSEGLYFSDFEAFTFNQLNTIKYRAQVEWCWRTCEPPICY